MRTDSVGVSGGNLGLQYVSNLCGDYWTGKKLTTLKL